MLKGHKMSSYNVNNLPINVLNLQFLSHPAPALGLIFLVTIPSCLVPSSVLLEPQALRTPSSLLLYLFPLA